MKKKGECEYWLEKRLIGEQGRWAGGYDKVIYYVDMSTWRGV